VEYFRLGESEGALLMKCPSLGALLGNSLVGRNITRLSEGVSEGSNEGTDAGTK
jgi:hypothetical protein